MLPYNPYPAFVDLLQKKAQQLPLLTLPHQDIVAILDAYEDRCSNDDVDDLEEEAVEGNEKEKGK